MQLGIIENWSEEGFKKVAGYGLGAVELCYNTGLDPAELWAIRGDVKKWSEQYKVKVGAVGRWGADKVAKDTGAVIGEELAANKLLVDFCAFVGCPVFNTGVNYVESLSYLENCNIAVGWLDKLVKYGKKKGVKIATYNCNWNNFVREPKAWEMVHGKLPELGIKFDPSHAIHAGADYISQIAEWGSRFYHVHIKGVLRINGKYIDEPPAGLDMIDWRQVMGLLYAHKYDAMLSIEPHSNIWKGEMGDWGVRMTIKYLQGMIYQ